VIEIHYHSALAKCFFEFSSLVIHEACSSSVQLNPNNQAQVLTSSADSSLKIIDIRTWKVIHTFSHSDHVKGQQWSGSTFSPDGRCVASASSSNGIILIWDALDCSLKSTLSNGHTAGIISIDWCRHGDDEHQIASLDRRGSLVLWA
jgi:autophagy-related protein 16-1